MDPLLNVYLRRMARSSRHRKLSRNQLRRQSPLVLCLLILFWCIVLGIALAQAQEPQPVRLPRIEVSPSTIGTVDSVSPRFALGQELYLQNCATCHIALPPSVLPTETWRQLLRDPRHYGIQLPTLLEPGRTLIWNYLQTFSRSRLPDEQVPFRVGQSRYFRALHPKLELSRTIPMDSCATCHPGATQYNFRSLTPEWQNAP